MDDDEKAMLDAHNERYTRKDTALAAIRSLAMTPPERRTKIQKDEFVRARVVLIGEYGWNQYDIQVAYHAAFTVGRGA